MAFVPAPPFVGRMGAFGMAAQVSVNTHIASPTVWFRLTGGSYNGKNVVLIKENFAVGNMYPLGMINTGETYQGKNVTFELDYVTSQFVLMNMFGGLTPVGDVNANELFPMTPLSADWQYPSRNVKVTDAQIYEYTMSMVKRGIFTGSMNFSAVSGDEYTGAATTKVLPTGGLAYAHRDHTTNFNGNPICVESSSVMFKNEIEVIDTTCNGPKITGFERAPGGISCQFNLTVSNPTDADIFQTAFENPAQAIFPYVWKCASTAKGSVQITANVQVTKFDQGSALSRTPPSVTLDAVWDGTISPFTFVFTPPA